ncbi:MAG: helix-turn-helix transcriptional regulator [Deltaproteobacteria bacterium]|nr:helix-turn-helix transcriptional regulator [Deltaproteobacteria bacterium]
MEVVLNQKKIKELIKINGYNVRSLALQANLSRQGYYDMFKSDYQPVSKGLYAVAEVLGVSPIDLLTESDNTLRELNQLLHNAAQGDARNFEVLPAIIYSAVKKSIPVNGTNTINNRILAAAAQIAYSITNKKKLQLLATKLEQQERRNAFFFGSDLMELTHIIQMTPVPMAKHNVFGVFELKDFERHFK